MTAPLTRAQIEHLTGIWERYAKSSISESHQSKTTAQALRQLLDETRWKPIDGNAMSGKPVILAVIDDTGDHEPVIGEARYYETQDDWYWGSTSPLDYPDLPISQINFGKPKYYRDMPVLPKGMK